MATVPLPLPGRLAVTSPVHRLGAATGQAQEWVRHGVLGGRVLAG